METMNNSISSREEHRISSFWQIFKPSNYNPRKNFDVASLRNVRKSIRQQGVLQPIRGASHCGKPL